jgi:hypothetical protein
MESNIKEKEENNIFKKFPNSRLMLQQKKSLDLSRNNGSSFYIEKPMKSLFNEESLLKKIKHQNTMLSLNNTLYNNNSSQKSVDLPFDIKLLYRCKKYLKSIDNEIIKEREQLYKVKTISEKNKINNNSISNSTTNNGTDYRIYYKHSEMNDISNNKLSPINLKKQKDLNNIRTFKYNDTKSKRSRNLILKEKKLNNLSEYSATNKKRIIFDFKNNNNFNKFLQGSSSTKNLNSKMYQTSNIFNLSNISKVNSTNDFFQKAKEENNNHINYSSIENKKVILLHPIKNIKALGVNNNNKISNLSTDILIPKLPPKNSNNISEKESSNEIKKNVPILKLYNNNNDDNDNDDNILNNYQRQIPKKENINKNKITFKRSASSIYEQKIYKRIFNTNTNTINDISSIEEENGNNKINQDKNNNKIIKDNAINDNKENHNDNKNKEIQENNLENDKDNKDNKDNNNFKRLFRGRKRTKIHSIFLDNKKINNKFLEKIKSLNNKYPNKDAFMTHQIKINKKLIIESQSRKITKMIRKQDTIKSTQTEDDHEIEIQKNKYFEYSKNNEQALDNLLIKSVPKSINNKIKNCSLSSILIQYIFLVNEFSSIFIPLVDITQKRKSFIAVGKLYIINHEMKVFEDKKTKFVESKTINNEIIERTSINFISKELLKFIDNSYPDENFLNFENYKPKTENYNNNNNSPIPKRYPTNKSTIRLGKGRTPTKRKKLTFIEKMTMTPYMCKEGLKPISILEKDEFFEVRKKGKNKDIKSRIGRRRNSIIDPNKLKSLSHKPLEYINALKQFRNKTDYFDNLKDLIRRGEVLLFIEYFNDNSKNINLNSQDQNGNTLLILAIRQGLNTICKLLMKNGIDVNAQNRYGNSALHYALSGKNFVLADELRKFGAIENCKNKNGLTPWDCIGKNIDD